MRLSDRGGIKFAFGMLFGTAALGLAGCSSTPPQPYNQYLAGWKGKTEQELVVALGIPDDSHDITGGGRMLEYAETDGGDLICTTRFTISAAGRVDGWWYKGSNCTAPPST